jgi:FAD/FMN-containing dehydrogenase
MGKGEAMSNWTFPQALKVTQGDPDVLGSYASDALYTEQPRALARPTTAAEVAELLRYCSERKIPVTPCGSQTSMTGASVSSESLILATEKLGDQFRVFEDPDRQGHFLAEAQPAILLSEFQDQLAHQGYFYPPDPTSRREAMLGSTIATNASGEDTYKYGSTRAWVRELDVVTGRGEQITLKRTIDELGDGRKNTCGYPLRDNPIDLFIGSEGTLGVVTRVVVEVLPKVPQFFSILFFVPSEAQALEQVLKLHQHNVLNPRCLEYMDSGAVDILKAKASGLDIPAEAQAALYVKQEFEPDAEEEWMERWADYLESTFKNWDMPHFMESVQFAGDTDSQAQMRIWRHAIPATMNERAAKFKKYGGGKVGTDWYVPLEHLKEMFSRVRQDHDNMEWVVFGHIGNGHPHFNFLAKNAEEYKHARHLLAKHCQWAVDYGGGVSGEHGLGKLKSHLLSMQYDSQEIQDMVKAKHQYDPAGILAPGNIFTEAVLHAGVA